MTGEEVFNRYGQDALGPWEEQPIDVQEAWEAIAVGVTNELAIAAEQLLGSPPYECETPEGSSRPNWQPPWGEGDS